MASQYEVNQLTAGEMSFGLVALNRFKSALFGTGPRYIGGRGLGGMRGEMHGTDDERELEVLSTPESRKSVDEVVEYPKGDGGYSDYRSDLDGETEEREGERDEELEESSHQVS